MSREIDERVVQMKFESGQFEKNVQTSIHSLDELKKGLDFKNASKGFENLDKASKGLKFDGLTAGIEALNNRFTLLGITGLNVMNRIANAAINTGERMIKSLSTDQISNGFQKYADKTSAVQTIMSATAKDFTDTGKQMEYVNEQLEKLNWFTDETSYNFLDMVSNIGKFTSNQIPLDQSVTSMQGIATWAAQAGANAGEASRAMYNLSQAISVGSVKLIDWKSIENANMATASFKETVIDTALAVGTLVKKGDEFVTATKGNTVSISNFNEALSDGWFTSEVLLKTLDKYGSATNRLNEIVDETGVTTSTLIGYIDDYTDAMGTLSKASKSLGKTEGETSSILKKYQSTANDLVQTLVKTGLSYKDISKYAKSYKAGTLDMTKVSEELGLSVSDISFSLDQFLSSSEKLEEAVKGTGLSVSDFAAYAAEYKEGTFDLASVASDLGLSMEETKAIMDEFQDETMQFGLKAFKAAQEAKTFEEAINSVKDAVSSGWMQTFEYIFGDYEQAKKLWTNVANILYDLFAESGNRRNELLAGWADLGGREELLASMYNIFTAILKVINQVKLAWRSVFPAATVKSLLQLTDALYDFTEKLIISDKAAYTMQQAFRGLFTILDTLRFIVVSAVKSAFGVLKRVLDELNIDLSSFVAKFTMGTIKLNNYVKTQTWATKAIEKFGDILVGAIRKIKEFIKAITEFGPVKNAINVLHSLFTSDFNGIASIITFVGNTFAGLLSLIAETPFPKSLSDLKDFFVSFGDLIGTQLYNVGIDFGEFFDNALPGFKSFSETLHTLPDGFKTARDTAADLVKYLGTIFKQVDWSGVALLATGVAVVALVYKISDAMVSIAKSIAEFAGVFKAFKDVAGGAKKVLEATAKVVDAAKFAVYGAAAIEFAVALGILAGSLVVLSKVPVDDLTNAAFVLGLLAATIAGFVYAVGYVKKDLPAVTGLLVSFAATIATFVWALNAIDVSDPSSVIAKMAVIETMVLSLVFTSYLMGKYVGPIKAGTASLLGIVASVWLMIQLFKSIGKEDPKQIAMAAVVITPMMLVLAGISRLLTVTAVLEKDQKLIKTTSIMKLIGFILSLYLLIGAIKMLGKSDPKVIIAGITALIPIFLELAVLGRSVSFVSANVGKLGPMLIGLSLALYLLHGVIKKMAELSIGEMAKGGAAIVALNNLVFIPLIKVTKDAGPNAAKAGLMLLAMAGTMAILQLVVKTLGKVDFVTLLKGVAATSALILSFAPLIKNLGNSNADQTKNLTRVIIIVGMLGAIAFILANYTEPTKVLAGAASISAMLLSLSGTLYILDKIKQPKLGTLFAMVGAIALMTAVVAALSYIQGDPKIALANAAAMGIVFLAIAAAFKIMDGVKVPEIKKLNTYLGVLIVVGIIMATLGAISKDVDPVNCLVLATAMSEILLALSAAIVIMSNTKSKPSEKNAIAMTWFVGAIGAVMVILGAMSKDVDPVAALAMATGVSEIMIALGVAARLMTKTKMPEKDEVFKWAAVAGAIGIVLGVIALIPFDPTRLLTIATGISELFLALSVSMRIMSGIDANSIGKAVGSMFALTGLMALVGIIIAALSYMINPDTVLPIVASMSLMLVALSGCVAILSVIPSVNVGTAINAVASMTILVGGMALLMYALGKLVNGADAIAVLQNGGEVLKQIGIAIGGFVGGIIGGIAAGVMASFPYICQCLTDGAQNLQGFYDMLENIPGGVLGMIGTLVGMVGAITAAEFISGLKALPGIGSILSIGMATLPADFASLGVALAAFDTALGDINAYRVKAAAEAVSALAAVQADTTTGGLFGFLFGNSDFDKFVENVPKLGEGLKKFAEETDGINEDTVKGAVSAADMLVALEKSVSPVGGLLNSELFGEHDIGAFGERLASFARSLVVFGSIISGQNGGYGLNETAVEAAQRAGQLMVDLENALPPNGGLIQDLFLGNKDLAGFGLRLQQFANGLVTLGSSCADMDMVGINNAVVAARRLIDLESGITTSDNGLWGKLFGGEGTFSSFGKNLIDLGEGLRMLGNKANVTDFDAIDRIIDIITKLGDVGDLEKSIQSLVGKISGMVSSIQQTLRDSYQPTLLAAKQLGEHLVNGIVIGVNNKTKDATGAIAKMAKALVTRFEQEMDIHSPSVVMEKEGEYVVKGVAEGIKKDMSAEEAAEKKAQNIISAFQTLFDKADLKINFGNVKLEGWKISEGRGANWSATLQKEIEQKKLELDTTGEKVKASYAKLLALRASGADEKTVKEAEIAYLEMSNSYVSLRNDIIDMQIDSAESMIEEIDLLDNVRQAEYNLWLSSKEGKESSAAEKSAKEMALLVSQLDNIASNTAILYAKHQAIVKEFGEDSAEARNAYIKALESEQKLNETYDSIMDKQKETTQSINTARNEAFAAYREYMKNHREYLTEMGYSIEEINKMAKEAANPNWDNLFSDQLNLGYSAEELNTIMAKAHQDVSLVKEDLVATVGDEAVDGITVKLVNGVPEAVTKAGKAANKASKEAGQSNADAYTEGYLDNLVKGMDKVAEYLPAGTAKTLQQRGEDLIAAKNNAEAVIDEYAYRWKEHSPSRVMMKMAGYLVEGTAIGIRQNGGKAVSAASDMAEDVISGFSLLTQNLSAVLQDDMDLSPVITPVLNMDDIVAGSKKISGILSNSAGLDISSIDIRARNVSASLKNTGTIPDEDSANGGGSTVYNFTQNNYSPKALSRYDIYRQTRNQFSQLKGATSK